MLKIKGFSLIELILVILLLGILSVTLTPRWLVSSMNINYEIRRLLDDIRYTQSMSMLTGQRYRWVKLSATTYQITNENGTAVILPSGTTQLTFPAGITFGTITGLSNNLIAFDSLGAPYTDSGYPGTSLASAATISLNAANQSRSIQINPETGYGILL